MYWPRLRFLLVPLSLMLALNGCGGDEFESSSGGSGGTAGTGGTGQTGGSGGSGLGGSGIGGTGDTGGSGGTGAFDAGDDVAPPDASEGGEPDAPDVDAGLALGAACSEDEECASTLCVDGVCCGQECGPCLACNASGHEGSCTPVPDGENPEEVCGAPGDPCSGSCDGAGSCAYPDGTPCGTGSCESNGIDLVSPQCDGLGSCETRVISCDPFMCDPTASACFDACDGSVGKCVPDAYCDGAVCLAMQLLGAPCDKPEMCYSNQCVDGFCCNGPCSATCESCRIAGSEGTCTPFGAGQDPDGECLGADADCNGACNGASQCVFPGTSVSCGDAYCAATDNMQLDPRCNGGGACQNVATDCGLFDCEAAIGACLASCVDHAACVPEAYCEDTACNAKKDNAALCGQPYECLSGYCEPTLNQPRCCNTVCSAPMDCTSGECLCQGLTCPAGETCVPWFRDLDQDSYGNAAGMELGCEGTAPKDVNGNDYVRNMDDCYDTNPAVHPGQTAWFQIHRGDGSFDYDCNLVAEKEYDDTVTSSQLCTDCKNWQCKSCGGIYAIDKTYGYLCKIPSGTDTTCGPLVWQSFKQAKECGQPGTLWSCNHQPGQCTSAQTTQANTMQRCR